MRKYARRLWAASALLALAAIGIGSPAAAVENETFGLTPHPARVDGANRGTFAIPLELGATFEDAVRLYNRTDQPVEIALYPADAEAGVDGTITVGFRGSRPKGVGAWIDLARDEVDLPPRGEVVVKFRVTVRSAEPSPDLGAIVAENTARGIAANLAQRINLVVRTAPANSPTTSVRARPVLLRSPWVILAILGLLVALAIVWLVARRARRPRDAVVSPGELARREPVADTAPAGSRPVLRRLGEPEAAETSARRRRASAEPSPRPGRVQRPTRPPLREPAEAPNGHRVRARRDNRDLDDRPLLDDMVVEVPEPPRDVTPPEPVESPQRKRPPRKRPAKRKPQPKRRPRQRRKAAPRRVTRPPAEQMDSERRYIPLDEL